MPNAIMRSGSSKKVFVGDEMVKSGAESSYLHAKWWRRPHDRGIVVDWVLQQKIWDRAFNRALIEHEQNNLIEIEENEEVFDFTKESFESYNFMFTQPPLIPTILQNIPHEVCFELYGFNSVHRSTSAFLSYQFHKQTHSHPVFKTLRVFFFLFVWFIYLDIVVPRAALL